MAIRSRRLFLSSRHRSAELRKGVMEKLENTIRVQNNVISTPACMKYFLIKYLMEADRNDLSSK